MTIDLKPASYLLRRERRDHGMVLMDSMIYMFNIYKEIGYNIVVCRKPYV